MKHASLIVVGTSAGGLEALTQLLVQLPRSFAAPIFIVQHLAPDTTGEVLCRTLGRKSNLPCSIARHGQAFEAGHVYIAPSDSHLMIGRGKILITKGARENRSRPGIDPLFRSAAVTYRSQVIGVLLTGYLDDGTAGLEAIHRCGGVCIVQEPRDAAYPDMPQNAINRVKVDHVVPLAEMGELLAKLLLRKPRVDKPVPEDLAIEAKIAERVLSDLPSVEALGEQVPFNCPDCGGVLWKVKKGAILRFRCHTGHAFTGSVLIAQQTAKIEETLWVALRMFEERRNLLTTMGVKKSRGYSPSAAARAKDTEVHIERIRSMLKSTDKATSDVAET